MRKNIKLDDFLREQLQDKRLAALYLEECFLDLSPEDARFLAENLLRPLESPEKEAPHLYQAIKHHNL